MEIWLLVVSSMCLVALLRAVNNLFSSHAQLKSDPDHSQQLPLPPKAPSSFLPLISGFLWSCKSMLEMEASLRSIHTKLGPIVTLHIASMPAIFISSRSITHKALVQNGDVFADRPKQLPTGKIISCNQHNINSNDYEDKWRILRCNLTSQIFHPSQMKSFFDARSRTLMILIQWLRDSESSTNAIEHLRYSMFCLLCFMCFGDHLEETHIGKVEAAHLRLLLARVRILNLCPPITKLVFRSRWRGLFHIKNSINDIVIPLIRARKPQNDVAAPSYVDSLLELELPEEDDDSDGTIMRKMKEKEERLSEWILATQPPLLSNGYWRI